MRSCEDCSRPCESPYNEDGECWPTNLYQLGQQNKLPKLDMDAYEELWYRARNEVPPGRRENDTGTQG